MSATANATTTLPAGTPWYDYPIWPNAFGQNGETGIDLRTPIGTPITSLFGGTVESASHQAWGWQVVVDVPTKARQFIREVFVHLDRAAVQAGQQVGPGSLLGFSGGEPPITDPKYSAGPHTELDLFTGPVWQHTNPQTGASEVIDPTPLIRALGNPFLQGQGQGGAQGTPLTSGGGLCNSGISGLPGISQICSGIVGASGTAVAGADAASNFFGALAQPSTWLRVGGAILGLLLIIVAVSAMLRKE